MLSKRNDLSKQRRSYPDSVEFVCWKESYSHEEVLSFLRIVQHAFPQIASPDNQVGLAGKGWKRNTQADEFFHHAEKKGVANLTDFIYRDLSVPLDIRLSTHKCQRINVSCLRSIWDSACGSICVESLTNLLQPIYGHFSPVKYFNIDQWHRIAPSPTFGEPDTGFVPWEAPKNNKLLNASEYEKMLDIWEFDQGIGTTNPIELFTHPLLVYPVSILTEGHLELEVTPGITLSKWILEETSRGTLRRVNTQNHIWEVGIDEIKNVTCDLWSKVFFRASEYFEVWGWDHDLCLPRFRHIKKLERK